MSISRHRVPGQEAFTIVEVMVALLIFSLAAVMFTTTYVNVLTAYERASGQNDYADTLQFARACLFAIADIEQAEEGDSFESANGQRATWRCTEIEPTLIPDLFDVTFECEIISDSSDLPSTTIVEKFRMLRPTWSIPADREALRLDTRQRIEELTLNTPSP